MRREPAHGYRADIEGMRAVAVLAVVAYHVDVVGGGFVGVDVFFVLSGFLITRLLWRELATEGSVSLAAILRAAGPPVAARVGGRPDRHRRRSVDLVDAAGGAVGDHRRQSRRALRRELPIHRAADRLSRRSGAVAAAALLVAGGRRAVLSVLAAAPVRAGASLAPPCRRGPRDARPARGGVVPAVVAVDGDVAAVGLLLAAGARVGADRRRVGCVRERAVGPAPAFHGGVVVLARARCGRVVGVRVLFVDAVPGSGGSRPGVGHCGADRRRKFGAALRRAPVARPSAVAVRGSAVLCVVSLALADHRARAGRGRPSAHAIAERRTRGGERRGSRTQPCCSSSDRFVSRRASRRDLAAHSRSAPR